MLIRFSAENFGSFRDRAVLSMMAGRGARHLMHVTDIRGRRVLRSSFAFGANAGADVVVANHAHKPLRMERLSNGTFVAYALGNFCFTPGVGYYVPNVLADYSIVLNVFINRVFHKIDRISFHTVKSVVRQDGVAVVVPVSRIYAELDDAREREQLMMENEALVNCVRGGNTRVDVADEYEIEQGAR